MKLTVEIARPRFLSRRRRAIVVATFAATLALPASTVASHIFSDVPNTLTGHAAIEAVFDARITAGCTPTTYCPTAPVTREQMAIFLQRALPRIAGAQDVAPLQVTTTEATQNSIVLRTGGLAGGHQFVKADVSFTTEIADATGCPCTLYVYITTSTGISSEGTVLTLDTAGYRSGNATLTFSAPTASNVTIKATAVLDAPGGEIYIYTDMSAISGAFGSQGTDLAGAPTGTRARGH